MSRASFSDVASASPIAAEVRKSAESAASDHRHISSIAYRRIQHC